MNQETQIHIFSIPKHFLTKSLVTILTLSCSFLASGVLSSFCLAWTRPSCFLTVPWPVVFRSAPTRSPRATLPVTRLISIRYALSESNNAPCTLGAWFCCRVHKALHLDFVCIIREFFWMIQNWTSKCTLRNAMNGGAKRQNSWIQVYWPNLCFINLFATSLTFFSWDFFFL